MSNHSSYTLSQEFEVFAGIEEIDAFVVFTVLADYEVERDDPGYDPRSGNSLTTQRCPSTSVTLEQVEVTWSEDTDDIGHILKEHNIDKEFTLLFSYAEDGIPPEGKDIRPRLVVVDGNVDILETYKKDIGSICFGLAEMREVDIDD